MVLLGVVWVACPVVIVSANKIHACDNSVCLPMMAMLENIGTKGAKSSKEAANVCWLPSLQL